MTLDLMHCPASCCKVSSDVSAWMLQDKASKGESVSDIANHTCACGACFTQYEENGRMECVPKCDLNYCDLDTGVCNVPPPKTGLSCRCSALQLHLKHSCCLPSSILHYALRHFPLAMFRVQQQKSDSLDPAAATATDFSILSCC